MIRSTSTLKSLLVPSLRVFLIGLCTALTACVATPPSPSLAIALPEAQHTLELNAVFWADKVQHSNNAWQRHQQTFTFRLENIPASQVLELISRELQLGYEMDGCGEYPISMVGREMPLQQVIESLELQAGASVQFEGKQLSMRCEVDELRVATPPWAEHRWAGIAEDPPRIIESPATAFHQEALTELRSMGQNVRIISSEKSAQFNRAVHMALLNTHEFKHLKYFLSSNKSGVSQFRSSLQLYLGLWVKPSGHYQAVRSAAVACVLGTFLLMSWHTNQQQSKLEKANLQHLKNSLGAAPRNAKEAPFAGWLEQIRKFGQDERANLLSLKISWDEQGEILTTADLSRARKRVPKGCSLNSSTQAQCSVGATNQ